MEQIPANTSAYFAQELQELPPKELKLAERLVWGHFPASAMLLGWLLWLLVQIEDRAMFSAFWFMLPACIMGLCAHAAWLFIFAYNMPDKKRRSWWLLALRFQALIIPILFSAFYLNDLNLSEMPWLALLLLNCVIFVAYSVIGVRTCRRIIHLRQKQKEILQLRQG